MEKIGLEKQATAIRTFLSIGSVFESPKAGHLLMADLLCGLHCQALRKVEPSFHPAVSVHSDSPEVLKALKRITKIAAPLSRWKQGKIQIERTRILNYSTQLGEFSHHIQDFSEFKRPIPECRALKFPVAYTDSMALVVGADAPQIREAAPYLENAAVIFLNSEPGDFKPTKLSPADYAAYDPEIISQLKDHRKQICSLLFWWWLPFENENAWAARIVQEARDSFGNPDIRYIRTELDPKLLRDQIRYRVLLSFLDEMEDYNWMSHEDLEPYRQNAKEVFDPAPPEPVSIRRAEDPDVFIEVMRALTVKKADSIVADGERFVKTDKPLAAWRRINGTRYLVFLEKTWATEYKRAVTARKDVDTSYFQKDSWVLDILKILAKKDRIKHTGNNPRYRYDLMEIGARDDTYVVAIPAELIEN